MQTRKHCINDFKGFVLVAIGAALMLGLLFVGGNALVYAAQAQQYNPLADFTYRVTDGELTITGYVGEETEVKLAPEYMIGVLRYPVTAISPFAFEAHEELTYAELPDSLEVIGEYAFYDCLKLKTVFVKGGQTEIETGALGFYYISKRQDGVVEGFILEGYVGSTAEAYAAENSLTFRAPKKEAVSLGDAFYASLADAVSAANDGDTVRLNRDLTESATIGKNITLDLSGHKIVGTVTVDDGCTLKIKDRTTDDFSAPGGYGLIQTVGNAQAEDGYIALGEKNGTSYHRLSMQITSLNLRPGVAGIYYGGHFRGDEAIKTQVKTYGMALSVGGAPTAENIAADTQCNRHTALPGDSWVCGDAGSTYGTLLTGIWKPTNSLQQNTENANTMIHSVSYLQLTDGTILLGQPVSMRLRDVVEAVDVILDSLSATQAAGIQAMYDGYGDIMSDWVIPNLLRKNSFTVTFRDFDGKLLDTCYVLPGGAVELPADPTRPGYTFSGWDRELTAINGDMEVTATYEKVHNQLYFAFEDNGDGTVTATLHIKGDVKLFGLEAQLSCTLSGMTLESVTPIADGLGAKQNGENVMLSYVTTTGRDLTEETALLELTFRTAASAPTASIALWDVDIFDETFADETYTVAGNTYGN